MENICRPSKYGSHATLRPERQREGPRIRIAVSRRSDCKSSICLEEMLLVDSGHEHVRDFESEVTPRLFVTYQELETF